MEPFKNLLNFAGVRRAGLELERAWPAFDRRAFERAASAERLAALEMKARAMCIADALEATLPESFDRACSVIDASLGAPVPVDGVAAARDEHANGLAGWIVWPLGEFVARRGLDRPERALRTLRELTQRLTAEFAIRPFVVRHPELVLATLQRWTNDPSAHVRRLCSEGTRPRLPWGLRLDAFVADPSPTLPLLAALQDDSSEYVRRSVANHLNDIAKDHPDVVVAWVERHLPDATAERRGLLSHASRTLVKARHAPMLALCGAGAKFVGRVKFAATPARVRIGETVELRLELASTAAKRQTLLVDYLVHHVRANGATSPKVFKGWKLELGSRERRELVKRHSFRPVTTRKYYPGRHTLEVSLNGSLAARVHVELRAAAR
ncbi:MAG: DNA alkylation repair protein [Planctomycetes bacterium]|nr:DNA alkylation repair protein [Planctomycetota bacterium]